MLEITHGYKVGRAVLFYDLTDPVEHTTKEKVSKEQVVKECENGSISNAKIQWWEGKPIVRCTNKNLPLTRLDNSGNVLGTAQHIFRTTSNTREDKPVEVKSTVVGKVRAKKQRSETAYAGYDLSNRVEQQQLKNTVSTVGLNTVEDLFRMIANDFKLSNTEEYLTQFAKKINTCKRLDSMHSTSIAAMQESIAIYLMNMANIETRNTYMKYRNVY